MKNWLFTVISVLVAGALLAITRPGHKKMPDNPVKQTDKGFALMELFTSQGCNSCPSADALLGKYAEKDDSNIIPIAFHVDYWNRLGWTDSFSNHQYALRQEKYDADYLHADVYTPQLIINGEKEMLGSDKSEIKKAVSNALNETPSVKIAIKNISENDRSINVVYTLDGNISNATLYTVLIQHTAFTHIKAGENNGVKLMNYNVARDFNSIAATASGNTNLLLPPGIDSKEFSVVLFVQNNISGKISGAVKKVL